MDSNLMQYYTDRAEKLYWINRDRNARRFTEKSQREKSDERTFIALGYGSIVLLFILLLVTR